VDVSLLIRHRLHELGLDQKDLAAAAQVTESYISQLLARKKAPPAPARTDIYEKIGKALKLRPSELSNLADQQRKEELRKKVADPPRPLFKECRALILRKCNPARQREVRRIFEKEPFGEFERLVTQKLLDVAKGVARVESQREEWLRMMAQLSDRSYQKIRAAIRECLNTDLFDVSPENSISFLDPIIDSWDVDLKTFGMEVVLNRKVATGGRKRFEFTEQDPRESVALEPGLQQFLRDEALSGDATEQEIEFLKGLKLNGKQPSPLYYYRELQNLRDPLHFPPAAPFMRRA
jgi:transcriptional regulator with XRE-family HTH domain